MTQTATMNEVDAHTTLRSPRMQVNHRLSFGLTETVIRGMV